MPDITLIPFRKAGPMSSVRRLFLTVIFLEYSLLTWLGEHGVFDRVYFRVQLAQLHPFAHHALWIPLDVVCDMGCA